MKLGIWLNTELTSITYSIQHSIEAIKASRVVIIVYVTVWICHGDAGKYVL